MFWKKIDHEKTLGKKKKELKNAQLCNIFTETESLTSL